MPWAGRGVDPSCGTVDNCLMEGRATGRVAKAWRRWLRISASARLVVIVALVPLSFVWHALWDSSNSEPVYTVRVSHGVVTMKYFGNSTGGRAITPPLQRGVRFFSWRNDPTSFSWTLWPEWDSSSYPPWPAQMLRVPLWIPAFVVGLPLALTRSWWRKRGPGTCVKCGYSLAGLGAGRVTCPECGHVAAGLRKEANG